MAEREYSLKTVTRAFEILRTVQEASKPVTLSEIAEATGQSTSNVFRFLKTLEASGHVIRDSQKSYSALTGGGQEIGLTKGLTLLDHVSGADENGMGGAELARLVSLDVPQVERALRKLEAAGCVEAHGDRWRISGAMVRFLRPILHDQFLERFIRPVIAEFGELTGETVSWYVRRGWEQIVVEVRPGGHALRYVLETGARYPLYLGAAGKAHLATLPEEEVAEFLEGLEPEQLTRFRLNKPALLEELRLTRSRGYAISQNERVEGAASVACAVKGADGDSKGVISVMMPGFRTSESQLAELGEKLHRRIADLYTFVTDKGEET